MSAISRISATSLAPVGAPEADSASRVPQRVLGQQDFLRLLSVQFQYQDPMKPIEDTAFIAQMAQFSALEQASAMSRDMATLRSDQLRLTANSYLGHRVTVAEDDGRTVVGDVAAIDAAGQEPRLVVNGAAYPLSAVLRVEPAVVNAPPPPNTGGG